METAVKREQDRAVALLHKMGMARLSEFRDEGIAATTVSRLREKGLIVQLGRGLVVGQFEL